MGLAAFSGRTTGAQVWLAKGVYEFIGMGFGVQSLGFMGLGLR